MENTENDLYKRADNLKCEVCDTTDNVSPVKDINGEFYANLCYECEENYIEIQRIRRKNLDICPDPSTDPFFH